MFPTYFRDSDTGLDYADHRYHAPGQGRFLSPDPSMDNVEFADPGSWNAYAYVNGDPINLSDPNGLETCGQTAITRGVFAGQTVSDVMTGTSGNDLLAQIIWHEGGVLNSSDLASPTAIAAYEQDLAATGSAVLNQWDVDNGRLNVIQNGRPVCPLGQCLNRSLQQIIIAIATYTNASGNLVSVFDSSGHLIDGQASALTGVLNTEITTGPQVVDQTGILINQGCEGVLSSLVNASNLIGGSPRVSPNGLTLLFWNQAPASSTTTFPGSAGYTGWRDARANGETFWGLPSTVRKPPRGPTKR
jgi:RHS repeat-associated protein